MQSMRKSDSQNPHLSAGFSFLRSSVSAIKEATREFVRAISMIVPTIVGETVTTITTVQYFSRISPLCWAGRWVLKVCTWVVAALCFQVLTVEAGTPRGRILSSLTTDRDTIDFGYLMAGNDSAFVFRSLYFVNDGDVDLVVRDSGVEFSRLPPANSISEFSFPAVFPLPVEVGRGILSPSVLTLRCQASTFLLDAPEGENAVKVRVRLAMPRVGLSDSTIAERTFVLRFIKTVRPLWITPRLNFDTLYAGSSLTAKATAILRNTDIRRGLIIDDTTLLAWSGSAKRFVFDASPLISFSRDTAKPRFVDIRYTAGPRGSDSVRFGAVHFNPSVLRQSIDTAYMELCGVSVEQKILISGAKGKRTVVRGDTIDVGAWTVGARDSVGIAIENRGNISFFSRTTLTAVQPTLNESFFIVDSLHRGKRHIAVSALDSMRIVYAPATVGNHLAKVTLVSDIASRVLGVPDSVTRFEFYLRGVGRERVVTSLTQELLFDSVSVRPDCPTSRTINLRLRNSSNTAAEVVNIRSLPAQGFSISSSAFIIPAQSDTVIAIVFAPTMVSQYNAVLIIQSGVDDGPILLQLKGVGVPPGTMDISLPAEQRVFPGNDIVVSLWGRGDLIRTASRCIALFDYDTTVLRFREYDNINCAAASGIVQFGRTQGRMTMEINMPVSFFAKDTLIKLRFQSMLGLRDRTSLSIPQIRFGDQSCEQIFSTVPTTSEVKLDSLCGLRDKLPIGPVAAFAVQSPSPNPLRESGVLTYRVATAGYVQVAIFNLVGECVYVIASGFHSVGSYEGHIPGMQLENGVYVIRLHAGNYNEDTPLVVSH